MLHSFHLRFGRQDFYLHLELWRWGGILRLLEAVILMQWIWDYNLVLCRFGEMGTAILTYKKRCSLYIDLLFPILFLKCKKRYHQFEEAFITVSTGLLGYDRSHYLCLSDLCAAERKPHVCAVGVGGKPWKQSPLPFPTLDQSLKDRKESHSCGSVSNVVSSKANQQLYSWSKRAM